ncbi:MAG: 50S ribosomal protein L17 [Oscillospiraceae bacterium]|nr:50S ribosomal protein L17 [Oscillospiraceae bacterium]
MPGTRKLSRPTAHRMSMLRGMVTAMIENERMETTVTRAKDVAALVEKMITLGKEGSLAARRRAMSFITKEDAVKKLFEEIAPRYASRAGGYTRVTRIGPRRGDAAEIAVLEFVEG